MTAPILGECCKRTGFRDEEGEVSEGADAEKEPAEKVGAHKGLGFRAHKDNYFC